MFNFKISDTAVKDLEAVLRRVENKQGFYRVWGGDVRDKIRQNARAKGGKSFWRALAASTQVDFVSSRGASVVVTHVAAAQKQFGGRIAAKNSKYLTIPITEEAKRKRAGEFDRAKLFTITSKKGNKILGYSTPDKFHALFLLRKAVDQKADPYLPSDQTTLALGEKVAQQLIEKGL